MRRDIDNIAREYTRRARLLRNMAQPARAVAAVIPDEHPRQRFAREVIDRLDGPILRYSVRLDLLRVAADIGLTRFDACVIIAQVQHRAKAVESTVVLPKNAKQLDSLTIRAIPYIAAVALQIGIIAAVWAVAFR